MRDLWRRGCSTQYETHGGGGWGGWGGAGWGEAGRLKVDCLAETHAPGATASDSGIQAPSERMRARRPHCSYVITV